MSVKSVEKNQSRNHILYDVENGENEHSNESDEMSNTGGQHTIYNFPMES